MQFEIDTPNDIYTIDDMLLSYFNTYLNNRERPIFLNIMYELLSYNEIDIINNKFDPNSVEERLLGIIQRSKEELPDDIRILIHSEFRKCILDYLDSIGIDLVDDIEFIKLLEIITALRIILDPDISIIDTLVKQLDVNDMELEITIANILSNNCNLSGLEVYELIEDIDDNLNDILLEYYNTLLNKQPVPELEYDVLELLDNLRNIEEKYVTTIAYKEVFNSGMLYEIFIDNIKSLYSTIESIIYTYTSNNKEVPLFNIGLEIMALLYLSNDTRPIIEEAFKQYIDIDTIDYFRANNTNKQAIKEILNKMLEDILVKG